MIDECIACEQSNKLEYLNEEKKVILCLECEAVYLENEFPFKKYDIQKYNPTKSEVFLNKAIGTRVSSFGADAYINFLKENTEMKFKTALDVGAFTGVFVEKLNEIGIDACGIESNKKFVDLAITKKIEHGFFDTEYKTQKKFDLISLTGMIMYVRDNYKLLSHVKSMLNPKGFVFITMVNPKSESIKEKLKKGKDLHIANMLFSKKNFEKMEDKIGLKLMKYSIFSDYHKKIEKSNFKFFAKAKTFLNSKETYHEDSNGNLVFIILKNE